MIKNTAVACLIISSTAGAVHASLADIITALLVAGVRRTSRIIQNSMLTAVWKRAHVTLTQPVTIREHCAPRIRTRMCRARVRVCVDRCVACRGHACMPGAAAGDTQPNPNAPADDARALKAGGFSL
jgi:hypothetical protein